MKVCRKEEPKESKEEIAKKKKKEVLLLHVSKRMTNNNTMQCLAVVLSLAHTPGILVQTCGRSLGESMSHSLCRRVRQDV